MTSPTLPMKREYWLSELKPFLPCSLATIYRRIESGEIKPVLPFKPYKLSRKTVEKILSHVLQD